MTHKRIGAMVEMPEYSGSPITVDDERLEVVSCPHCGRSNISGSFTAGTNIEIKCSYCRKLYGLKKSVGPGIHQDYRCKYCKKLIFKGELGIGSLLIVSCPRKACKRETRVKY